MYDAPSAAPTPPILRATWDRQNHNSPGHCEAAVRVSEQLHYPNPRSNAVTACAIDVMH